MRTTTTLLAAFVVAPALLIAGFASAEFAAEAPTAATLDARLAASADLYYDLAGLAVGESFAVAYQTDADVLRLRSTRTADGYALAFVPGDARPASVTVRYLYDGEPVAEPVTFSGDAPVLAGTSDDGPDSYHYVWVNGQLVLRQDYKKDEGITDGSSAFTTAAGETVRVTDVAFELSGLDAGAPTALQFETPRDLRITAQSFGQPLR